jgi:hypothetical protein
MDAILPRAIGYALPALRGTTMGLPRCDPQPYNVPSIASDTPRGANRSDRSGPSAARPPQAPREMPKNMVSLGEAGGRAHEGPLRTSNG